MGTCIDEYRNLCWESDFCNLSENEKTRVLKWILSKEPYMFCGPEKRNLLRDFQKEKELQDRTKSGNDWGEIEELDDRRSCWGLSCLNMPLFSSLKNLAYWLYAEALYYKERYKEFEDFLAYADLELEYIQFHEKYYDENGYYRSGTETDK